MSNKNVSDTSPKSDSIRQQPRKRKQNAARGDKRPRQDESVSKIIENLSQQVSALQQIILAQGHVLTLNQMGPAPPRPEHSQSVPLPLQVPPASRPPAPPGTESI